MIKFEPEKKTGTDLESKSQIQWQSLDFLIEKMKELNPQSSDIK